MCSIVQFQAKIVEYITFKFFWTYVVKTRVAGHKISIHFGPICADLKAQMVVIA